MVLAFATMTRTLLILALLAAGMPNSPALADEQPKVDQECLSYDSAYENAPLFAVKTSPGEDRAWLYKKTQRCPKEEPCASKQQAYLVTAT